MNHDIKDIARMLSEKVEEVCHHLLPGGKKSAGEWESDSIAGGKGKSLKVRLTGNKAGIWCDFSNGEDKGDLLDLWVQSRNLKMAEAIREAKTWLGIREPQSLPAKKSYAKPKSFLAPIGDKALKYLISERKLLRGTLDKYRVGTSSAGEFMTFPSYNLDGELVNVKHIGVERDTNGKKIVKTEAGCPPALFGWQAFTGGRTLVITEGEIDAMTMGQYGYQALSVPFGAGTGNKNDWIDFEWDNLAQFETIYLCYDNDEAGQGCVEEVARRLGLHRCRSVKLLFKDANECLQKGSSEEEIADCLKESKTFDPPEIRSPIEFRDRVQAYFYPSEDAKEKIYTPALFGKNVSFRPGELTIWTGCNSHGKSVMVGQLMLGAAMKGMKAAIASMEMKPEQTLGRILKQFWATRQPETGEIDRALDYLSGRLWIYDLMGNVSTVKLLELIEFSVRRHGVSHFVIDSLMKCDVSNEDYDGQRRFLNTISTFAKKNDCHIHLVAHPRKHEEDKPIGRVAVSGSGDIANQADNVISVWRNKAKERNEKTTSEHDAIVLCDKQRETGWEGFIPLDFSKPAEQYMRLGKETVRYDQWAWPKAEPQPELAGNWNDPEPEPEVAPD